MKRNIFNLFVLPVLSMVLLSACAAPPSEEASGNSNASQSGTELKRPDQQSPATGQGNGTPLEVSQQAPAPSNPAVATIPAQSPAQPASAGAQPKLVIPVKKLDFGKQPKEKSLTRSIVVKNTGKADLRIEAVVPSCGCTTVDFPKVIAAGKSGAIKVKVDTGKSVGSHTKSVTIQTNDPEQPAVQVELTFTVK